ncbi:MAG: aspartyl/asparaginyl beta-hydroxylase domain-containing protein [Pseudomonadales bacterium]
MELQQPFIRIPFAFDVKRLKLELAALEESCWMPHPSGMVGNTAVALVSKNGTDNNDFEGRMQPTKHLQQCEYIAQIMHDLDEVLGRSRLMRLDPGCEVSPHVDFNYHWYSRVRIHIPIVTDPAVMFHCGEEQVHMKAGECWLFDSWRRHHVVNGSNIRRVHLVLDTAGSSRFWRLVHDVAKYGKEFEHPDLLAKLKTIAFQPGKKVAVMTEQYNSAPVMAPGEMEAMSKELMADVRAYPKNDPAIVDEYAILLNDLVKDWRELWHTFGMSEEGKKHYQNLLNKTVGKLRPDPRILLTSSNKIGIRPIIMQRIIRAALYDDQA